MTHVSKHLAGLPVGLEANSGLDEAAPGFLSSGEAGSFSDATLNGDGGERRAVAPAHSSASDALLAAADAGLIGGALRPIVGGVIDPRPRLTAESWKSAVSGSWGTAADWSGGTVPNATVDATIAVAGTYTVTIAAAAADSLTLDYATAKVADNASFTVNTTIALTAGTFTLGSAGIVQGGTIAAGGGSFVAAGGTLSGVTYQGTLSLSQTTSLSLVNGFTLTGKGGTGAGVINLTGQSSYIYVLDNETLANGTLNIGSAGGYDYLTEYDPSGTGLTLTLASNFSVAQTGAGSVAYLYDPSDADSLVNKGTITAGISAGTFGITGFASTTNSGQINVSNFDTLTDNSGSFVNSGTITASGSYGTVFELDTATITNTGTINVVGANSKAGAGADYGDVYAELGGGNTGSWTNQGVISVSNGGDVLLEGTFSLATLKSVSDSNGYIDIAGTLQNSGTLAAMGVESYGFDELTLDGGGMVSGGTISDPNGQIEFNGNGGALSASGTLSGVTYEGTLNLGLSTPAVPYEGVALVNGFTLTGAGGTGAGTINLTGQDAYLYIEDSETLGNGTLNIGGADEQDSLELYDASGGGLTLTLASNFSVVQAQAASYAAIYDPSGADTVINRGTILAQASGGVFDISSVASMTNAGRMVISNLDTLTVAGQAFDNAGVITVSGSLGTQLNLDTGTIVNTGTINAVGVGADEAYTYIGGSSTGTWTNQGVISASNGGDIVLGGTFSLATWQSVSVNNGYEEVQDGLLQNSGTLVALGTITTGPDTGDDETFVDQGGTIAGGTVSDASGQIAFTGSGDFYSSSGTLSGVTYQGTLNLNQANDGVALVNGFSLAGKGGVGSGVINLTGSSAFLYIEDNETLANGTLNIGSSGGDFLQIYDPSGTGLTLTLANNFNIVQSGSSAYFYDSYGYDNVVNTGAITAGVSGGQFYVDNLASMTNSGQIAISNGDTFTDGQGAFVNSGTVTVSGAGGAALYIDTTNFTNTGTISVVGAGGADGPDCYAFIGVGSTGSWTNQGVLSVANGGDLILGATISLTTLESVKDSSGYIEIAGTLQNTGTLVVGAFSSGGSQLQLDGGSVVSGGTISDATGLLYFGSTDPFYPSNSPTLSGVSYQGTMNLTSQTGYEAVAIANGFTLAGAGGVGSGTINVTGEYADLIIADTETLANGVLNLGGGADSDFLSIYNVNNPSITLTLAASFSIVQAGTYAYVGGYPYGYSPSAQSVVNQGTITANIAGGQFTVNAYVGSFTNSGTIIVGGTDTFTLGAQSFASLKAGTLSGTYQVGAGSLLELGNNEFITALSGAVTLSGAGSTIQSYNTATAAQVTIDTKLATINAGGALSLLAGRSFSAKNAFADNGALNLGGGTFTETSLTIGSTGTLSGFGKVTTAVADGGKIIANGGLLTISGAVSGSGTMQISAGATLEAGAATAAAEVTTFAGTGAVLKLDAPSTFLSPLAGLASSDVIDFVKTVVTSVSSTGDSIAAVTAGGTITLALTAPLVNAHLGISSDGNSGSDISVYGYAQSSVHAPEPVAFGNHHVGDTANIALSLTNTAPANGYSEALDASLGGASSAGFTAGGSFTGLGAQMTNSSSLVVGLNTASAGAIGGTATITLNSDGTGIDGFGLTSLGTQTVNVTGAVYNYAAGTVANGGTVTLANSHVGAAATAGLSVTNSGPAGSYTEALDASLSGAGAGVSGSGTLTGLMAGSTNSTSLVVGYTASASGAYSGTETLGLVSDGTGIDGLGTTTLASQTVTVKGAAYAYAVGSAANHGTVTLANVHVGQAASGTLALTNAAPGGGYSENLDASLAGASAGFSASGTLTGLAAGATNSTSLVVGTTQSAGGAYSGTATLGLVSDGTGIDGLGTTALASQTVTITGAAYAYAVGVVNTPTISLGVVHVGSTADAAVSLSNAAAANGYSEALDAAWGTAGNGVTDSGSVTGLAAGGTNATSLLLGISTGSSGVVSGTASLGLVSDGSGIDGLGTTTLASQTVAVSGTVDNYAVAAFTDAAGPTITGSGTSFTVNLGQFAFGAANDVLTLGALNAATGLADLLQGTISTSGGTDFSNSGFGTFSGLGAGQSETAQAVTLSTANVGTFSETVVLTSAGTNASGYLGPLATETLTITGTILPPGTMTTYTLSVGTNNIVGQAGGDVFQGVAGSINSHDNLTGGVGANSLVLLGGGLFDVGAPATFVNIPTIVASEGQAQSGTIASTVQTVFMRNGVSETLNVTAGVAATGNKNAETIAIYDGIDNDAFVLSTGVDQLYLGSGTDTVTLGSASNQVFAGGGTATLSGAIGSAGAEIVGNSASTTTLDITSAGSGTLNAADAYLTVNLAAGSSLKLGTGAFITASGIAGTDTLTAAGISQTLIGGTGDSLVGYASDGDIFLGTSAELNGDKITNFAGNDVIDVSDLIFGSLTDSYSGTAKSGTLTLSDGTHNLKITMEGSYTLSSFHFASDGHSGTDITFI